MAVHRGWLAVAGIVFATMLITSPGRGQSDKESPAEAVRAVLDRQVADWNKGDLDGFLAGYWNSPKVVFQSGGQRYDGWEAMRDRYRRRYQAEGRAMGRLAFSGLDVEPLGPEAVLARPMATDDARRFHAGRPVHRDLPQVPQGVEDRARSHVRRRPQAGREEGRLRGCAIRLRHPLTPSSCGDSPMRSPCPRVPERSPPAPGRPATIRLHARWPRS